jgi:hypothetical protein
VRIVLIATAFLIAAAANAAAQERPHTGTLVVVAAPAPPLTLTPADLLKMPRTTITVKQPDGRGVTHEGVLVAEVLKRVGAPLGKALRGDAMATYIVASATDGYRVVFSLAELDPEFSGSEIMIVDRTNGQPLLADQGPMRLVVPRSARRAIDAHARANRNRATAEASVTSARWSVACRGDNSPVDRRQLRHRPMRRSRPA